MYNTRTPLPVCETRVTHIHILCVRIHTCTSTWYGIHMRQMFGLNNTATLLTASSLSPIKAARHYSNREFRLSDDDKARVHFATRIPITVQY